MEIVDLINAFDVNTNVKPWHKRDTINHLAIHHSEVSNQTVFDFNKWHTEHNGWHKISYHYVIDEKGIVYQCNNDDDLTYHVRGSNSDSIGICLIGNFDITDINECQLKNAEELVFDLCKKYALSASQILGHREFPGQLASKTCPGDNMSMDSFRLSIGKKLVANYDMEIHRLNAKLKELESKCETKLRRASSIVARNKKTGRDTSRMRRLGPF